jgi:large conductance mechanosensitive channel
VIQGFKEFLMRGNIVDLAVAVVIGTAFAAVVEAVVSALITPLLNSFGGGELGRFGFQIVSDNEETFVNLATVINALVVFVLTAAVVYLLIVVPMNTMVERRRHGSEPEPEEVSEDVMVLREIRDLLASRQG